MSLGKRIRDARKSAGFSSQQALADVIGCTREAVTMWETDKVDAIGGDYLPALARALKRSVEYIQTGKEARSTEHADVDAADPHENIIGYAQHVATGEGSEPEEWVSTHTLKFRADSLARKGLNPDDLAVYYSTGVSMEPRIKAGDAIMVNRAETKIVNGALYLFRYDGEGFQAKRLQKSGKTIIASGDNSPPFAMDEAMLEIIGRIRWIGSWEGYDPPRAIRSFDPGNEATPADGSGY